MKLSALPASFKLHLIFLLLLIVVALVMASRNSNREIHCDRGSGFACSPQGAAYHNASLPVSERVDDLLGRMTREEKIGQMALVEKNSVVGNDVRDYGLGALLSGGGGKPATNTPPGWLAMIRAFQAQAQSSRLSIPLLYGADANHGHANVPGATIFPHAIGLGAANDPELVKAIAKAAAEEAAATGVNWNFSPALDAPQDIRWGRVYETFGNDENRIVPLGVAAIEGTQERSAMIATAKHFFGLGAMAWGTSTNKEFHIDQGRTPLASSAEFATYVAPFEAAVNAGVGSVMIGLSAYGDSLVVGNKDLVTGLLKNQLGFSGFVVSDWYGVYSLPGGQYRAAVQAINAGVDMVMLPYEYPTFVRNVEQAVQRGEISEERLNDAVRRILTAKFAMGLFDNPEIPSLSVVGSYDHRALARQAASRSLVVLKNQNTLPIDTITPTTVYVAGSAADNIGQQAGGWTVEWQGVDGNWLPGATSILSALRTAMTSTTIQYDASGQFSSAERADIGIAIVGEKPYAEGRGDTATPTLSQEDQLAIERLRAVSRKVIVVVVAGRPLILGNVLSSADAVIMAWLPGSEGAGVVDGLLGHADITGTLPLGWPARVTDLGTTATPLFPLGFGIEIKKNSL